MTTPRLILCPPSDTALARLNDIRELDAKIAKAGRKAAKTGDTSEVHTLNDERAWLANTLADHLLAGAVYTDDTPDPRVAALEARVGRLRQYVYWLENMSETWLTTDHRKPFLQREDLEAPQ